MKGGLASMQWLVAGARAMSMKKTSLPKSSHGINRDRFVSVGSHAPEKSICRLC